MKAFWTKEFCDTIKEIVKTVFFEISKKKLYNLVTKLV